MKRLRIRHTTGFHYEGEIAASYNEARMLPLSSDDQLVLYANIDIHPNAHQHSYADYWGTRVRAFDVLMPHRELSLQATSLVEVRATPQKVPVMSWAELSDVVATTTEYVEQVEQTESTEPADKLVATAREIVANVETPADAAREICEHVGAAMEYVQGVTGVHSTAKEAWEEGKGVCQDITHIAIGALRSANIPARYVSGYLHPHPDPVVGETVTGESHAWIEWFGGEWVGFDPTNRIDIGDRHVLVGHGRDYNDVPPLRGVYAGPFGSELFVNVEITRES